MPGVMKIVFDQCRTGLVTAQGGIIRKPTELVSNSEELLRPLVGLTCRGDHQHVELAGSALTAAAQVWTWDEVLPGTNGQGGPQGLGETDLRVVGLALREQLL